MIENGLTTWLADQLVRKSEFAGDRNKYEMYDLEYSLALFMNLSQSQTAVRACSSRARNLFKSLCDFIAKLDVDVSLDVRQKMSFTAPTPPTSRTGWSN